MGKGTISVVIPTYNVAGYLPDFLASIDAQRGDLSPVEFLFVDDGSPDDAAAIIEKWMSARPKLTTRLIRKENGGLSSARNAGLEAASGEWVTFPDPDDKFSPGYFAAMTKFVASKAADRVHIVAGRFIYLNDDKGTTSDSHPLRFRFRKGTRVVDLGAHPRYIHVAANTGLFRRDVIERYGLRYDPAVKPVWEDGHLTARYLSKFDRPRIAMMAKAIYYYRRRSDGSSLMDGQWLTTGKYVDVPRGWLDALRIAAAEHAGHAPRWIQNMVLYDALGYFKQELRSPSPTALTPREVSDRFFSIMAEVMEYIDVEAIDTFRVNKVPFEAFVAVRMYFKGCEPRPDNIFLDQVDAARGLVRLHWYYSGDAPVEEFLADGLRVAPVFAKTRPCKYYGRTLMYERFVWLPLARLSVSLDGVAIPLRTGPIELRAVELGAEDIWTGITGLPEETTPVRRRPGLRPRLDRLERQLKDQINKVRLPVNRQRRRAGRTRWLANLPHHRHRFRDAWLLIDRDVQAQDNAEHLYRYLRAEQPKINAWFVLSRTSPDWARLQAEGFRLIAHGSREHQIALLNCKHLLSSQIDNYITSPLPEKVWGPDAKTWHYTFLQHGVTKDDLSIWINPKPIDLMITATPDEHHSIVDDTSPYVWSDREVRMTGFPRHDRLLTLARGAEGRDPKLILVMPTWRRSLVLDPVAGGNDRELRTDFWHSTYAMEWRKILESEPLHKLADEHGYQLAFVPHPNMQRYLDNSPLPDWVQTHRFLEIDIQKMLVRGAMLVTDYSSMGFEMAYLERPVVYFQFDQDEFFNGGHAYRRGVWSYENDGFGPVTVDADAAVEAIADIVRRNGTSAPEYAERMARAFPYRDGACSRRTYEAVLAITRPLPEAELFRRVEPSEVLAGRPVADELAAAAKADAQPGQLPGQPRRASTR